jgi:hypothetical protein
MKNSASKCSLSISDSAKIESDIDYEHSIAEKSISEEIEGKEPPNDVHQL